MCVTDLADPNRCQATLRQGQCRRVADPGSQYCSLHGNTLLKERETRRQYLLTKIEDQTRLSEFSEHDHIKSLRDEIALTRILIERRFNAIRCETDMLAAIGPLNSLLLTTEKLVKTCFTMEQSLGSLLARETVIRLAQELAQVIVEELKGIPDYEYRVDRLIEQIFKVVDNEQTQEQPALTQHD